jgi:hypothetical protein
LMAPRSLTSEERPVASKETTAFVYGPPIGLIAPPPAILIVLVAPSGELKEHVGSKFVDDMACK